MQHIFGRGPHLSPSKSDFGLLTLFETKVSAEVSVASSSNLGDRAVLSEFGSILVNQTHWLYID